MFDTMFRFNLVITPNGDKFSLAIVSLVSLVFTQLLLFYEEIGLLPSNISWSDMVFILLGK